MDGGGGGSDGGPGTDSGTTADAGLLDAGDIDAGDIDAGPPRSCGGLVGAVCEVNEWCDYAGNICGGDDGTGVCRPRPEFCAETLMPVCACDGTIYTNACEANAAGVDVNDLSGGCTVPTGQFACGFRLCDDTSYCTISLDDTGMPPSYRCTPFPSACDGGGRDCTCVAGEPCGEICSVDGDGHVTVTCPGG